MARLILAAFRRQRALYTLWLVSLCVAVTGLVIVDVFRQSLTETLKTQGRKILTADVTLSSRRTMTADDLAKFRSTFPDGTRFAEMIEMFAMVTAGKESRLGMLRFVSDDYPLLGDLQVDERRPQGAELKAEAKAWVASDVLALMDVQVGGTIKIGKVDFTIAGVVRKDSSQTFRFGNMAPRIYLHRDYLAPTGLVQYGSTFSQTYLAATALTPPKDIKKQLERKFTDSTFQITVPTDLEQGSLRVLSRLLDFLGLTGLITLALGWVGVYYLGRRWLALEASSSAVLKCLGLSSRELRRLLLTKLFIVLTAGVVLGGVLAWLGSQLLLPFVRPSLPAEFELVWSWRNTLLLLVIGPLAGGLLLFQAIHELAFEKPLALFQERAQGKTSVVGLIGVIVMSALLFVLLTFLQARSWQVTWVFLAALTASVTLVAGLAMAVLRLCERLRSPRLGWLWHLVTALWTRRLATSILLVTVSALAGMLSQLIPHLEKTLVGELKSPSQNDRPALFMVDIQDEQLEPLKKFLQDKGIEVALASPFIRARIVAVNAESFERTEVGEWSTREEEMEARFRNRGVNLSYRAELTAAESILEGKRWGEMKKDPPEISVEEGYAKRLKIKLGDVVRFDIQGVELETRVASLRKINWDSFQPNFFIQFPDGVLNDAPKTWVMAVRKTGSLTPPQMQTLITKHFPNVTSINIEEALDNVSELIGKLSSGLKTSSRLSLALGIFVFLLILLFQLVSARRDWQQLLVLGLTTRQVWWLQVICYAGLSAVGTFIGALMSLGVAWGLFKFAFDSHTEFDFYGMFQVWLLTWGIAIAGVAWLGRREVRLALDAPK